jgi:hypothetical protein
MHRGPRFAAVLIIIALAALTWAALIETTMMLWSV